MVNDLTNTNMKKLIIFYLILFLGKSISYGQHKFIHFETDVFVNKKETIYEKLKNNKDSINKYAQFCDINNIQEYIEFINDTIQMTGKFCVKDIYRFESAYIIDKNKVTKIPYMFIYVADSVNNYLIISKITKKKKNEIKINIGDTLNISLRNIFGNKLFFCTKHLNGVYFDFIFNKVYFENVFIQSYYTSSEINGIYINNTKISQYFMTVIHDIRFGETSAFYWNVNKKYLLKNWDRINKNGNFTILNTNYGIKQSDFKPQNDTIESDFIVEDIYYTLTYKKYFWGLNPYYIKTYLLQKEGIYYVVYSNKKLDFKIKKGDLVHLKIANITPFKAKYRILASDFTKKISFVTQNIFFKNVKFSSYYFLIEN
jgi:hypothetical protein